MAQSKECSVSHSPWCIFPFHYGNVYQREILHFPSAFLWFFPWFSHFPMVFLYLFLWFSHFPMIFSRVFLCFSHFPMVFQVTSLEHAHLTWAELRNPQVEWLILRGLERRTPLPQQLDLNHLLSCVTWHLRQVKSMKNGQHLGHEDFFGPEIYGGFGAIFEMGSFSWKLVVNALKDGDIVVWPSNRVHYT